MNGRMACLWLAAGAQAALLVQPEPHWGGVAPRYSSYYCDGSLKRTAPRHGKVTPAATGAPQPPAVPKARPLARRCPGPRLTPSPRGHRR